MLLDTGPLVAFLNGRDSLHEWALTQWGQIAMPMLSCESVLSEACHVLGSADAVMRLVERGVIALPFHLADHTTQVSRLLRQYASVPMSLADACLVRMSELQADGPVFTLDSDFRIYRRNGRRTIPTLMP
ncbi:MAG: PIN domain-containing protein [Candidatus Latescibacterota bacterium]